MNSSTFSLSIRKQTLHLSPDKCIYWEEEKAIILSDLHLGKSGHFRKEGIAVPQTLLEKDLQRLQTQINHFGASSLIVIGDLFHSRENREIDYFREWRKKQQQINIHLIRGNHDLFSAGHYQDMNILLHEDEWHISDLFFRHEPSMMNNHDSFQLSGHIHPGVRIKGKGKQAIKLPCFYFTETACVLPAFGVFTGLHLVEPEINSRLYAIADNQIIEIKSS